MDEEASPATKRTHVSRSKAYIDRKFEEGHELEGGVSGFVLSASDYSDSESESEEVDDNGNGDGRASPAASSSSSHSSTSSDKENQPDFSVLRPPRSTPEPIVEEGDEDAGDDVHPEDVLEFYESRKSKVVDEEDTEILNIRLVRARVNPVALARHWDHFRERISEVVFGSSYKKYLRGAFHVARGMRNMLGVQQLTLQSDNTYGEQRAIEYNAEIERRAEASRAAGRPPVTSSRMEHVGSELPTDFTPKPYNIVVKHSEEDNKCAIDDESKRV